jgi:hypothetical protein
MLNCPDCSNKSEKIIACGLPMYHCSNCHNLWGFWSWLYFYVIAPVEGFINGHFCYMVYEGSYWEALKDWLFGYED